MHCIQFIALAYGVMSWTYGSNRTGTTSFIRHNDAASYLVGYEGRRHDICNAYALWFWIMTYLFGNDIEKQYPQVLVVIGINLAYEVIIWFIISHDLSLITFNSGIAFALWFGIWSVYHYGLGDNCEKWYFSKVWWWLILSYMWFCYLDLVYFIGRHWCSYNWSLSRCLIKL